MKRMCVFFFGLIGTALFISAAGNPSNSPYGINVHLAGNQTLSMVESAGIKWIRIDINWQVCEPQPGSYAFTDVDRVVNYAVNNGISILAAIGYTPGWANGGKGGNHPPDNTEDWKSFVSTAVFRYKAKIKHWSIWNEPNVPDFFSEGKDVFVEKIFIPAAKAIHNQDPTAFVVGPDLAHLTSSNQEWFLWMKYILREAGDTIDVVSHHLYDTRGGVYVYELLESGEPLIPAVRDLVEESGLGDRPFWLTETGWNTLTVSEAVQGDLYLEILKLRRLKNYPDKIFFYEIQDDVNPDVSSWGILRSDLTQKPAYTLYRDFIAGKYPLDDTSPIPEEEKDDCYAERMIPTARSATVLGPLRMVRDAILRQAPGGFVWVGEYYRWSDVLYDLTVQDSRLHQVGRSVILQAAAHVLDHGDDLWRAPIPQGLRDAVNRWVNLAAEQEMPSELRMVFQRIALLARRIPLNASFMDLTRTDLFMSGPQRKSE